MNNFREYKTWTFELYMNSEIKPSKSNENLNIEKVPVLLEELKEVYNVNYEIIDTQKMKPKEIKDVYGSSANLIQNPKRQIGISIKIYEIFCSVEKGDLFGKEKPALIVRDSSGNIIKVFPHIATTNPFSLDNYSKNVHSPREKNTITIFDFLTDLKKIENM